MVVSSHAYEILMHKPLITWYFWSLRGEVRTIQIINAGKLLVRIELCVRVMSNGRLLCSWCWTYMSYYLGVNSLVAVLYVQWNHHLICCHKVVYTFNLAHFTEILWNSNDLFIHLANLFLFSLFVQSSTISLSCQLGSLTRICHMLHRMS